MKLNAPSTNWLIAAAVSFVVAGCASVGVEPSALTAADAGYVLNFKDADALRNSAGSVGVHPIELTLAVRRGSLC